MSDLKDPDKSIDSFDSEDTLQQTEEFSKLSNILAIKEVYIQEERLFKLSPEDIHPDPDQPRKHFDVEEIKARASSMDELGQHTPIKVYFSDKHQRIQIWFGETRWRAKKDYCKDRQVLCMLVEEPSEEVKFDNQVDENLQRAAFTVPELLEITETYLDRYRSQGYEDVVSRVAERLKRPTSEISRRTTIINGMKIYDKFISDSLSQVVKGRKLENLSALYFLAAALQSDGTERRKHPARDLVLQALNEDGTVTKAAAEMAYKQATGKSKLSYSWTPNYLELPEDPKKDKVAPNGDDGGADGPDKTGADLKQRPKDEKQTGEALKQKAPGRVLKSLSVDVLEDSDYLKLTANTGYITKEQALKFAENLKEAAESM